MNTEVRLGEKEYLWLERGLKSIGVFSTLNLKGLSTILPHMRLHRWPKSSIIVREGDLGNVFYLIYKGRVEVIKNTGIFKDRPVRLAVLKPGDFFGEMALLFNVPRTASCVAREDCEIFTLSQREFTRLVRSHKGVMAQLQKVATERLKRMVA